ncbi:helix-turn-helix domain-containing protein [Conchiformibius steedae]|uniref:XRE family transcriptional regulator n=1 Tax=Conchiformibius steedae TaxID=153493 RepID=A0A3P2A9P2_9NEIS|nr:helix-turn-helix transcriptional regulator [Conchiformibius steedae]RRD91688.1 XRE family transcriptional regulator [Conchiformibius steedae]
MTIQDKIRIWREIKQWSQEEMAEKMKMSPSGYAKIERGETRLHLEKLQQIAQIFNIDVWELLGTENKHINFSMNESDYAQSTGISVYQNNYYGNEACHAENALLKQTISHKDEIIRQQERELNTLREVLALLQKQIHKS